MKIVKSPNLNKSIDNASQIMLNIKAGDEQAAYRSFYDALCDTSPHKDMIAENAFTFEEMVEISKNLRDFGFGLEKVVYLPVYAFYRMKTFKYILNHRDELKKRNGQDAFMEAAVGLKKFFNDIEFIFFNTGYFGYAPLGRSKR